MATVTIGGRELQVWERQTPGGLGKLEQLLEAEVALQQAAPREMPRKTAAIIHCFVSDNDGVDIDWLLQHLPVDCAEIIKACIAANGGKVAEPGEAKGP